MKKFFMFMMAAVLLLGATSCNSCKREKQTNKTMVEKTIKSDYAYMTDTYEKFVWYESQVNLGGWLDEDTEPSVASVSNVFQYIEDGQPHVIIFTHYVDKCDTIRHDDFWVEDCAMNPDKIKVTYEEAYEWLMKANLPKPHSQLCILREPIGPYGCNPQYIFGNISDCVFVDAKTGKVCTENPAFEPNK